jgi:hypothetical protein
MLQHGLFPSHKKIRASNLEFCDEACTFRMFLKRENQKPSDLKLGIPLNISFVGLQSVFRFTG